MVYSNLELTFLVYISRAAVRFDHESMNNIISNAASRKQVEEITGILLLAGNHFIQILEGPKKDVHDLLDKIRQDSRHTELRVIFEESITDRRFAQWSINHLPLYGNYNIGINEILDLKRTAEKYFVHRHDLPPVINFIQSLPKFFSAHSIGS